MFEWLLSPPVGVFFVCLFLGAVVGILAGLLGIGGGLLVVPAMHFLLPMLGVAQENVMPMALATSLATIILTSGAAARHHWQAGNVDVRLSLLLIPGMVLGGLAGSSLVEWLPVELLPKVFASIVLFLALQMGLSLRSTASASLPHNIICMLVGGIIGTLSTLAGIGGGSLTVPYLHRHGIAMRNAIACSAVTGGVIALSGLIGFTYYGLHEGALPVGTFGYVYLPAWMGIVLTSTYTSRFGVRWASQWPTAKLKRFFALFLLAISIKMFLG
ncbi:sulfite exporter TauE/SafE family protein [Thaumasiovibrio sp. DFM-14]|uniref:sulfite exporter TauE/SafE family protein n=1 Tax=Thaumasiovibrio sp. DFM-14 TaxID=3384792 RepID=UPI0039A079F8